jgi:branched-chain amino acid transport system substrate-binding protein
MGKLYRLIIFSLLFLYPLGCSEQRAEPDPIRIGLIIPLSGELNVLGDVTQKAAILKINQINEEGGLEVNGIHYQLELLIEDDAGLPEEAVEATRSLVYNQNVVAIVGPMISRTAIPATIITEEARIPMLLPNATNPEATLNKSYVYRIAFVDSFQGNVMAQFVRENLQAQTTAVLFDAANKYNSDMAHIYRDAFIALGGEVVAFEPYVTGATDFSEQLGHIRAAAPDTLFLPNYSNEVLLQAEQARAAGIQSTLVGADGWSGILAENFPLLEDAFFSGHYARDLDSEIASAFQSLYEEAYGEVPIESAALTYDTLGLLLQAIQRAGVTPEAIHTGLQQTTRYEGVTGTIIYDGNTGDPQRSAVILHIVNGKKHHYLTINPDDLLEE